MPPGYFQNIGLSSTTMTPAAFSRGAGLIKFALTDEHFFQLTLVNVTTAIQALFT